MHIFNSCFPNKIIKRKCTSGSSLDSQVSRLMCAFIAKRVEYLSRARVPQHCSVPGKMKVISSLTPSAFCCPFFLRGEWQGRRRGRGVYEDNKPSKVHCIYDFDKTATPILMVAVRKLLMLRSLPNAIKSTQGNFFCEAKSCFLFNTQCAELSSN